MKKLFLIAILTVAACSKQAPTPTPVPVQPVEIDVEDTEEEEEEVQNAPAPSDATPAGVVTITGPGGLSGSFFSANVD